MKVKLTAQQHDYLKSNLLNDREALYKKLDESIIDKNLFELDEVLAYKIRDWASERLQLTGFDEDYHLTEEGQILEDVIDILYI